MDTVQLENLLLVFSPIVFGFFPALLDVIRLKRKPPNMLIALLVAISSLAWTPSRLDIEGIPVNASLTIAIAAHQRPAS